MAKKLHWTQTPEGRKKLSRLMKASHKKRRMGTQTELPLDAIPDKEMDGLAKDIAKAYVSSVKVEPTSVVNKTLIKQYNETLAQPPEYPRVKTLIEVVKLLVQLL